MKLARQAIGFLLVLVLVVTSAAALAATPTSKQARAKAKAAATAKSQATAKAKTEAQAAAAANDKAGKDGSNVQTSSSGNAHQSAFTDPANEAELDQQVAAARATLGSRPNDIAAREQMARSAAVLIGWLLNEEAVGNREKAAQLKEKLETALNDTGWRIQNTAKHGDVLAKQATGFLLWNGVLLKRDLRAACTEFIAAAELYATSGWYAAQCLLESAPAQAWSQMERAAKRGNAAALEWIGRRCLGEFGGTEKDLSCARLHLQQSADSGRPGAQTLLAFLLATGQGGPVDMAAAVALYKSAAQKGDARAMNNLGEIYEVGRAGELSLDEALRWYERSAALGFGSAQFNAGRLWAVGVGGKKDPVKARTLLLQAEVSGVPQARQVLDWLDKQYPPAAPVSPLLDPESTLSRAASIKNRLD